MRRAAVGLACLITHESHVRSSCGLVLFLTVSMTVGRRSKRQVNVEVTMQRYRGWVINVAVVRCCCNASCIWRQVGVMFLRCL